MKVLVEFSTHCVQRTLDSGYFTFQLEGCDTRADKQRQRRLRYAISAPIQWSCSRTQLVKTGCRNTCFERPPIKKYSFSTGRCTIYTIEEVFHAVTPVGWRGLIIDSVGKLFPYYRPPFLRDRAYETQEDRRRMKVISEVAQGSFLSPELWNAP